MFVSFIICVPWAKKSRLFSKKQSTGLSKLLTTCPRWFFEEVFFWKSSFFISSFGFERAFLVFCTNFCRSGRQYCFLFVNCTSLWWNSFRQKVFSIIIFGYWSQFYRSLFKFFSTELMTLFSTSPKDKFEDKQMFWQKFLSLFSSFSNIERKKKVFLVRNQLAGLSKLLTTCPRWFIEEVFFGKVLYSSFGFERVFLSFVLTCVGRAVSTAFCLSIAPVRGEILCVKQFFLASFSDTDRKFIGLCSNFFQPSWWHCFLRVRKINLKTNNCFDNFFLSFFFILLEHWTIKKGFFLVGNQLTGLSKLLTISQGDPLKSFFFEKVLFCSSLTLEQFFFLAFRQNFQCGVTKTALCLSIATICGKKKFCQKCFSPAFLDIQRNFVSCFRNFSGQLDKTAFYESEGSFWGHNFVWTKFLFVFFSCPSKNEQKINGIFRQKLIGKNVTTVYHVSKKVFWSARFWFFLAKLMTLHSTKPKDQFEDKTLFWQSFCLCFFHALPNLNRESSVFFRQKTIGKIVTTVYHVHVSKKVFWRIFFEKILFSIILNWATFVCQLDKNLYVPLSVLLFVCPLEQFVVKKFCPNLFYPPITDIDRKLISLCSNFFRASGRHCILRVQGSIWGHKTVLSKLCLFHLSFAYLERKNQGFFPKNSQQVCLNCLPRVQDDSLKKFFFWKSSFFIWSFGFERAFLVLSTNLCRSGRQYCFLFVNCTSLWWNSFRQKVFSPIIFGYWSQFYRSLFNLFSTKLTTLFSTSPKDQFEDKQLFWQFF